MVLDSISRSLAAPALARNRRAVSDLRVDVSV